MCVRILRTARMHVGDVTSSLCPSPTECVSGQCACAPGLATCTHGATTYCINTAIDPAHCGQCFNACTGEHACIGGRCVCPSYKSTECPWGPAGNGVQPTVCVDISSDTNHCGGCWQRCGGGSNVKCMAGNCTRACSIYYPTLCEVPGFPERSDCVNLLTFWQHCGRCFKTCSPDQTCNKGRCECRAGETACFIGPHKSVVCVNTQNSDTACGGCPNRGGRVCPSKMRCQAGQCNCQPGETECVPGRCFNLNTSMNACGSCLSQCNYLQRCVNGRCK